MKEKEDIQGKSEKKEWKAPTLTVLDVESSTLGTMGIAAVDGPVYS